MTSSSKKVDPILSAPTMGEFKKRFYDRLVKGGTAAAPGDALIAPLLRLHYTIFDAIAIHNAAGVGLGAAFVPFTETDVLNWSTPGHASANSELIERIDDVSTMLVQMRLRMPTSTAADKLIYENTKKNMIQTANATLVNALITLTRGQEGFKNLETHAAYTAHQDAFDVIPKAQMLDYYKHSFQSLLLVFAEMFARRLTASTVTPTSLNTPPDVESQTLDEYAKLIKDAGDALLKKKLLTPEALIDHLQAGALITYINLTADCKNLKKEYTSVFKPIRTAIAADAANDPRPFDMNRFHAHKKNLDTALIAAHLQEIKPPLSAAAVLRSMVAAQAPMVAAQDTGRVTVPSRSQGAATSATIPITCFHCNKPGHAAPHCPTAKTTVSRKLADKRRAAYVLARDARRTERETANTETARLARAVSLSSILSDTDTDNDQDEDEDDYDADVH